MSPPIYTQHFDFLSFDDYSLLFQCESVVLRPLSIPSVAHLPLSISILICAFPLLFHVIQGNSFLPRFNAAPLIPLRLPCTSIPFFSSLIIRLSDRLASTHIISAARLFIRLVAPLCNAAAFRPGSTFRQSPASSFLSAIAYDRASFLLPCIVCQFYTIQRCRISAFFCSAHNASALSPFNSFPRFRIAYPYRRHAPL